MLREKVRDRNGNRGLARDGNSGEVLSPLGNLFELPIGHANAIQSKKNYTIRTDRTAKHLHGQRTTSSLTSLALVQADFFPVNQRTAP